MNPAHRDPEPHDREIEELLEGPEAMVEPPPGLWDRIAAEAFAGDEQRSSVSPAPAIDIDRRRRRRLSVVVAAAAAIIVAVVGVAVLVPDDESTVDIALAPLPDHAGASGDARLVAEGEDGYRIDLHVEGADPGPDADLEAWLLTPAVDDMISLGTVDADGTVTVDASVDLDRFSVLDVSIEPRDGDPTHSGDSVVRGTVETS